MNAVQAFDPGRVSSKTISEQEAGQRIDNYLLKHWKGVPKSHIYRVLRRGEVRINKKRIKPSYKLLAGDVLRIPPVRRSVQDGTRPPDALVQHIQSRILYEDDDLMVINKPAGVAVHAGSGVDFGVIDALKFLYRDHEPVYLVHRLDRETSGCLLVARNRPAMLALQRAMREGRMKKRYLTLLQGCWQGGNRRIDLSLQRHTTSTGERRVQADENGKAAISLFNPLKKFAGSTLMQVDLLTGRTHQIRVHALEMGHPVAGDKRYGERKYNLDMKRLGLRRLFLHAQALAFPHPDDERPLRIEAPLDEDLQLVLEQLDS